MKAKQIRFFNPQENTPKVTQKKQAKSSKAIKLAGYISNTGKLVFPQKTIDQLGLATDSLRFQIGAQPGKRKLKVLYLVPTQDTQAEAFALTKGAKSYTIPLNFILQKGGVDYSLIHYSFTLSPFAYQEGVVGYKLTLHDPTPKAAYQGKPRGRKSKSES